MSRITFAAVLVACCLSSGAALAAYEVETIDTGTQADVANVVAAAQNPSGLGLFTLSTGLATAVPGEAPSEIVPWQEGSTASGSVVAFFPNNDAIFVLRTISGAAAQYRRADGTWVGSPQIVSANSFGFHPFDVAIDASGAAILAVGRSDGRLRIYKRAAGPETNTFDTGVFQALEPDGAAPTDVNIAMDPDGTAVVVYLRGGVLKQAVRIGTEAFSSATTVDAGPIDRLAMASNASGRAVAVWHRSGLPQSFGDWRGGVREAGGSLVPVEQDLTGTTGLSDSVAVAVDEDGRAVAAVGLFYANAQCQIDENSSRTTTDSSLFVRLVRSGETEFRDVGFIDDAAVGNIVTRAGNTAISWRRQTQSYPQCPFLTVDQGVAVFRGEILENQEVPNLSVQGRTGMVVMDDCGRVTEMAVSSDALLGDATLTLYSAINGECLPEQAPYCGDPVHAAPMAAAPRAEITAGDALTALKAAVGSAECALCECDVNDSGTLTTSDALLILKSAVGQFVTLACPACISN